ncbi:MAG: hypothetical protein RR397_06515 [Odoribacter sp.]
MFVDNSLKYRSILIDDGINDDKLDPLEICFNRNLNDEEINVICEQVKDFEYRSKEITEKLE